MGLEPYLFNVAQFLVGIRVQEAVPYKKRTVKKGAKKYMLWKNTVFRRDRDDLQDVLLVVDRNDILGMFHDELGH